MNAAIALQRRKSLITEIQNKHGFNDADLLILLANFELDSKTFEQEHNFYYFSGIVEPASILVCNAQAKFDIYVPNSAGKRANWIADCLSESDQSKYGFDQMRYLGTPISGYEASPFITEGHYSELLEILKSAVARGGRIFTVMQNQLQQAFLWGQLSSMLPELKGALIDISDLIAGLRRNKDEVELGHICRAIEITAMAHQAAASAMKPGVFEFEVQAALEFIFTSSRSQIAFPSIVAGGVNATILHYAKNTAELKKGDLVVIDIGARYQYYCADITRTFPVSGKFSKRQLEVYNMVLAAQEYIANLVRPGMYFSNAVDHSLSLNHLTRKFFSEQGDYAKYFTHSIGHQLGMDVHDVGAGPLKKGDVITIEPGIYIPDEGIGIRIEDNYLVLDQGAVSLSTQIPKEAHEIEALVSAKLC